MIRIRSFFFVHLSILTSCLTAQVLAMDTQEDDGRLRTAVSNQAANPLSDGVYYKNPMRMRGA